MHSFYVPDLVGHVIALPEEEAHHAVNVLRLKPGSTVLLLDGAGGAVEATIEQADKKACTARRSHLKNHPPERTGRIHIACAPTKSIDRFEWMLEKCTEIGVDRITPLLTERTERAHLRQDRLLRVLVSAMKQSQRTWLPQLDAPMDLRTFLVADLPQQRLFGWCEEQPKHIGQHYDPNGPAVLLIGPEGDFTPAEAGMLVDGGFLPVSLGTARLRTETAAVAACTWMNFAQQRQ